jgi:HK97 gp10 family phage protein
LSVTVSISSKELRRAIKDIGQWSDARVKAIKAIVQGTALDVERHAKERTPVDLGRLRSSIRPRYRKGGLEADVFTNVEYAAFVEFGTGVRGAASGVTPADGYDYGPSAGMKAQPYMFPAAERNRRRFEKRIKAELQKGVRA